MFLETELQKIDREYFRVIDTEDNVITLESKNTHHGWHIYRPGFWNYHGAPIIIFHRHENQSEYHRHATSQSLSQALRLIRRHDSYQINVRWGGRSFTD